MHSLKGIHHVTAITSSAEKIYEFFTYVLGMRLVKKSVNQDDIHTYHLFFADDVGSPGTDMTFFDFPETAKGRHGTDEIFQTGFRVPTDAALEYWKKRFDRYNVKHTRIKEQFGKKTLSFSDFDEQQYQLISDENNQGVGGGIPWKHGPVPKEFAINGLGPVFIRVSDFDSFRIVLEQVLDFREVAKEDNRYLFEVSDGGNGAQVIVEENQHLPTSKQGYGTVHHVAFRVEDKSELEYWRKRLRAFRIPSSGYVERYYFGSVYSRITRQILFEFATDGPGFMVDEPYETLGEKLALPPYLEPKREEIEAAVRPIDTVRSTKKLAKEW